jgi:hypothetical protein
MEAEDKYIITQDIIGPRAEIGLDLERFLQLKLAKETLSSAFSIEEKYELLIRNFVELESDVLVNTVQDMLTSKQEYSEFFDVRLKINQRMVNLLTSCRLYVDHIKQHAKACTEDDPSTNSKINSLFSTEYDAHFEYRFFEALRNYVQHRGLAVHNISHSSKNVAGSLLYQTSVFSNKVEFSGDKAFKTSVYNEMPEKVELIQAAKQYIASISFCHSHIRKLIEQPIKNARKYIEDSINEYCNVNDGQHIGLVALHIKHKEGESPVKVGRVPLLLEWDDVRQKLISRNSLLINLDRRLVTEAASSVVKDGACL